MARCSNSLLGILNVLTLLLSIPIIAGGVWLSKQAHTDCERFLEKPVIAIGVFLLVVSLAGIIGACCGVSWLLWVYLLVMFLLIVLLFCFTIFSFVVTNKGAGEAISGKGYKEYRLGDYSNWLQKRVTNNWPRIRGCLMDSDICAPLKYELPPSEQDFYKKDLPAFRAGCCKPSDDCKFTYITPVNWTGTAQSTNPDCKAWSNDPDVLCFNCQSCKAGLLDNIKSDWKKEAILNVITLVFLIIVYSVGCCAFRNNREDSGWKGYP